MVSYPSLSESPFEGPATPKPILRVKDSQIDRLLDPDLVYVPPSDTVNSDSSGSESDDVFMSGNARGGSDQRSGSSSGRRHSQQRRQSASYLESSPAAPYHAPVYAPAHPPPHAPYPGQYMMPPHTPYAYPPFHVPEQPQSIHAGYPTLATYPQYSPDHAGPSFRHPPPMSPAYAQYPPQPASYSPRPALYSHQHPQQHVYPGSAYPYHQHQHSPVSPQEGEGTWWYVPSQPSPHTSQPSPYFYPHPAPPQQAPPHPVDGDASPARDGARASTASSSSASPASRGKPLTRRHYHPNPPAHRSEWVMWAGNVPGDAGHDELWRFFTQPPDEESVAAPDGVDGIVAGSAGHSGVLSIFLISRSSCAFVNYETEAHLHASIARFNGMPLRSDPRCPRLVCRVRRKDDDLRAGVGGQRGMGMHTRWVKANSLSKSPEKRRATSTSPTSVSDPGTPSSSSDAAHSLVPSVSTLSLGSNDEEARPLRPPPRPQGSNSSGSHASTDSSILRLHFPRRFFILKSLTQDDLDLSVQTGLWATQRHNEGILDRAFRTSKEIFLIFSVNKSGEFYGYARMAGPIVRSESSPVPWARRDDSRAHAANLGGDADNTLSVPSGAQFFSPPHNVGNSPLAISSAAVTPAAETPARAAKVQSAPAALGKLHRAISADGPALKFSLDHLQSREIELDKGAPFRAMRPDAERPGPEPLSLPVHSASGPALHSVPEVAVDRGGAAEPAAREDGWGQDFKLEWVCTERLPFPRTRHIRNPWNHDREVKVSRDGTELEPSVGQALLDEWRAYLKEERPSASVAESPRPPARGFRGPRS